MMRRPGMLPLDDIVREVVKRLGVTPEKAMPIAKQIARDAAIKAKKPVTRAGGVPIKKVAPVKKVAPAKKVVPAPKQPTPKGAGAPAPYKPGRKQLRSMVNKQKRHEEHLAQLDRHIANAEHPAVKKARQADKAAYLKRYAKQQSTKAKNIQSHRAKAEKKAATRLSKKK